MITSASKILPSERTGPYKRHMAQASLRNKVNPVTQYSSQRFYQKEQEWLTATAAAIYERYEAMREVEQQPFAANTPSSLSGVMRNPYQSYELSRLFTQQAARRGLFFNQIV